MNLITLVIYIIWLISEIAINRLMRSKKQDQPNKDKNSLILIWLTIFISFPLAILFGSYYYLQISKDFPISDIGLGIIIFGIILRLIIIKSLGNFFTADVTIRENHSLKKDGFYKYLRHPSYFASLLSFIGFGFSLNNWISLAIIFTAMLAVFSYRIKIEEEALIGHFGEDYLDYKKSTKKIIPFIY